VGRFETHFVGLLLLTIISC